MNEFLISSKKIRGGGRTWEHYREFGDIAIYFNDIKKVLESNDLFIFLKGYVIPRNSEFQYSKNLGQLHLIKHLLQQYGSDFVNHLKGSFIIIIHTQNEFSVFNDFHAIKKFYFSCEKELSLVSDSLPLLAEITNAKKNDIYPAILALFQRPVQGVTPFDGIEYSQNACFLKITCSRFYKDNYFSPVEFIENTSPKYSINELVQQFSTSTKNALDYLNINTLSVTLTGGRDTRSVLSAVLQESLKINSFTFGLPNGKDVIASKSVSQAINIAWNNYYIKKIDSESYSVYANELLSYHDPFIHLHRAHRLQAIKMEVEKNNPDMVMMGCMGGDYSKGVSFNDYIVTEFMRLYFFDSRDLSDKIEYILSKHFIRYDNNTLEQIRVFIDKIQFLKQPYNNLREYLIAFSFIGSLHDIQDINIFEKNETTVFNPFMDRDFFEYLFNSEYSLMFANRNAKGLFAKLKGGELQANIICTNSKTLGRLPLANLYTPQDILGNRLKYLMKRIILQLLKVKDTPTFVYGAWFKEYIQNELKHIDEQRINDIYDMDSFHDKFEKSNHATHEGYWHKFSNVIDYGRKFC